MVLPVLAAVLSVAACGGGDDAAVSQPSKSPGAPAADFSAKEESYLAGLEKIDAGLVANEERAIRRAEETCADIKAGEFKGDALNERVAERLSGGSATIDAKQASQVVALMKANIC